MIGIGAAMGDAFYAGLAALGLKAFVSVIHSYDTELRVIGALIMFAFAVHIWRSHPHIDQTPQEGGVKRGMVGSLILTLTNPGVFLGFLGLYALAGIGDLGRGSGHAHADAIALVSGVFLGSCLWWAGLTGFGRYLRDKVNDKFLVLINHFSAALIGLFAVGTIVSLWLKF